jgi:hypothetical protein
VSIMEHLLAVKALAEHLLLIRKDPHRAICGGFFVISRLRVQSF